jgi:hypothetical protein
MHNIACTAINIMHLYSLTITAMAETFCFAALFLLHIMTATTGDRMGIRFVVAGV